MAKKEIENTEGLEVTKPEGTETPEDNKNGEEVTKESVEEIKAKAEAIEAEIKTLKELRDQDELKSNQLRRLEKAEQKLAELRGEEVEKPTKAELDVRDLLTLSKADIAEDSDKAQILKRYRDGGIISNYAEGLDHPGVKAEFDVLEERN